jgi:prepilin-type N-terminal cleavage/methylation domain-containing protein
MNPAKPTNQISPLRSRELLRGGFTLIEMLVVIAIISILMTAAGPVLDRLTSSHSPGTIATTVAGQMERARNHAIAKNTYVWVRLGVVSDEPGVFFIGVYESLDGTTNLGANVKGVWSAPRFANLKLKALGQSVLSRPYESLTNRPEGTAWIRFSPSGEAWYQPGVATESRIGLKPPATPDPVLHRWNEIGLQPTIAGRDDLETLRRDVATVQISGLTGQALVYNP